MTRCKNCFGACVTHGALQMHLGDSHLLTHSVGTVKAMSGTSAVAADQVARPMGSTRLPPSFEAR